MIELKRKVGIDVFQVKLDISIAQKQSPFVAILILAKELEKISAADVRDKLLPNFPIAACKNLLKRLEESGYFQQEYFRQFTDEEDEEQKFLLTSEGIDCAEHEEFRIKESGIYNISIIKDKSILRLINSHIVRTERTDRLFEDKGNRESRKRLPHEIRNYEGKILEIGGDSIAILNMEDACFHIESYDADFVLRGDEENSCIEILRYGRQIFNTQIDCAEEDMRNQVLLNSDSRYDEVRGSILVPFDSGDLTFSRRLRIARPEFQGNEFSAIELVGIPFGPEAEGDARKWYAELLFQNMHQYFFDDSSFREFCEKNYAPFSNLFALRIPGRLEFLDEIRHREDAFYHIAKLETIDYLNY